MAHTCDRCGGDVFIGEVACPNCRAPIPHAAEDARAAGVEPEGGGRATPPPPEGLELIIGKTLADQDARRQGVNDGWYNTTPDAFGNYEAPIGGYDDAADLLRPERDRQGNIIWDLKNALVGAVVVALFVAVVAYFVLGSPRG